MRNFGANISVPNAVMVKVFEGCFNMSNTLIRQADVSDLQRLVVIENSCFEQDRLSRRSLRSFIRGEHNSFLLAELDGQVEADVLVLYRRGTSLARMYSLAVMPAARGHGLAQQLCRVAEQEASKRGCIFMRLEVRVDNTEAMALYEKLGYRRIGRIEEYYEDGLDAWQYEKNILASEQHTSVQAAYYTQTTDFTCGPACLMMGMRKQDTDWHMDRLQELHIWREATTIFMTAGHGGCAPFGLALSAWQRGFEVSVYTNSDEIPFLDSVRGEEKKQVVRLVHEDFVARLQDTSIKVFYESLTPDILHHHLRSGHSIITLISTWRFNRNKAPHWVFVAAADEDYVYLHDPDSDTEMHPQTDYMAVPVPLDAFVRMACFGRSKLRSTLVLTGKRGL
jgi:ribosomal protein S18 acetylase RimI-like enzyme